MPKRENARIVTIGDRQTHELYKFSFWIPVKLGTRFEPVAQAIKGLIEKASHVIFHSECERSSYITGEPKYDIPVKDCMSIEDYVEILRLVNEQHLFGSYRCSKDHPNCKGIKYVRPSHDTREGRDGGVPMGIWRLQFAGWETVTFHENMADDAKFTMKEAVLHYLNMGEKGGNLKINVDDYRIAKEAEDGK